jgi:catechol 2,3-dioxygenase-like lactoylglutathione lyase family enzyme
MGLEENREMIAGGTSTIYVSNFEQSVRFYTIVLGLKLLERSGSDWATIYAGGGLTLNLQRSSPAAPRPGTSGAITIGFQVSEPLEQVIAVLKERGVWFRSKIVDISPSRVVFFGDPDGNDLYLSEPAALARRPGATSATASS